METMMFSEVYALSAMSILLISDIFYFAIFWFMMYAVFWVVAKFYSGIYKAVLS